jgi:hypothetical protein
MEIVMEKEAAFLLFLREIFDADAFQIDVFLIIHRIAAVQAYPQAVVSGRDMGDEALLSILQAEDPVIGGDPAELSARPYPEPEPVPVGMVLLADAGEIDVPEAVVLIKSD